MSSVLIIGVPGSGKSTSIRNLDPASTFIIQTISKPLPFKDYKSKYVNITGWDDATNNRFVSDDWMKVKRCIEIVNKRDDIKTLVIDDMQYIMSHEFMRRATEKGFDKFSEIASHFWQVTQAITACRENLTVFAISHSDTDNTGKVKAKTIGKMLEEKISIEGIFTVVLHSLVSDNKHYFLTQYDGEHLAKSPIGLFPSSIICNDLKVVQEQLTDYFGE